MDSARSVTVVVVEEDGSVHTLVSDEVVEVRVEHASRVDADDTIHRSHDVRIRLRGMRQSYTYGDQANAPAMESAAELAARRSRNYEFARLRYEAHGL